MELFLKVRRRDVGVVRVSEGSGRSSAGAGSARENRDVCGCAVCSGQDIKDMSILFGKLHLRSYYSCSLLQYSNECDLISYFIIK